ncbi:PREDICTED: RNA pseudouridylate synthase domain-containing protein 4-like isoform X2 [Polistes dominula]|uniref:RNA pseudouridylate synthase domain-containing protein 4-like isoform X2 n=1 Tax=Polistes dominula TaxID=743375 RepID=A0ABM1IVT4_POLDO|nr:PREDICTED: RNA pseudouridylate synthase domain-containing protein 4-like isoform X2 [Polistes dominula]
MQNAREILKCRSLLGSSCNCMIDKQLNKYFSGNVKNILEKEKIIHHYRKLHPWKSQESFSKYLLKNVLYNKDGLVAINKPYGISPKMSNIINKRDPNIYTKVLNGVDYTLDNSMEFIAKELGYSELVIVKAPEKFMSGVTLLAANDTVQKAINSSYIKSIGKNILNKTYWIITVRVPNQIKGDEHLCMRKQFNSSRSQSKIVIDDKWSKNAEKRRAIKILNVQFKVISNSTKNLSSLIEIKASTIKWHALRLYASTRLYAPILGDNLYGSRIHNVAGKWLLSSSSKPLSSSNTSSYRDRTQIVHGS